MQLWSIRIFCRPTQLNCNFTRARLKPMCSSTYVPKKYLYMFYFINNQIIKQRTIRCAHASQISLHFFPLLKVGKATKFHSENYLASKVGQNRLGRNLGRNTEPAAGEGLRLTYGYGKARPQRMVTVTCSSVVQRCTLHRTPSQLWEHELFRDNYPCDTRRTAARVLQGCWVEGGGCTKGLFVVVPSHPASFCPWLSRSPDKVICFCLTFLHLCVVACSHFQDYETYTSSYVELHKQ